MHCNKPNITCLLLYGDHNEIEWEGIQKEFIIAEKRKRLTLMNDIIFISDTPLEKIALTQWRMKRMKFENCGTEAEQLCAIVHPS